MKEIPVLLYHNMGHYPVAAMEDGLHAESFEQQMGFLAENGYNVVSLSAAIDHLTGHTRLPPRSIAVTIDGGYRDAYTNALPVLKNHNFHATFLLSPSILIAR
jgi:peptidoglycan/xylan/chitin deacetylase (PgdA/CDA1 family)